MSLRLNVGRVRKNHIHTGALPGTTVFIAALPCSKLSYAEASLSIDLQSLIRLYNNAFAYFGETTQIIVPGNLKASVTKHTIQELFLNPTYRETAEHYNTVGWPA